MCACKSNYPCMYVYGYEWICTGRDRQVRNKNIPHE
jgi:hypothetical protein